MKDLKNKKFKFTEEVAQQQLDILLEWYDIFPDEITDEDQRKTAELNCSRLLKGIRKGKLIIEEKKGSISIIQIFGKENQELVYEELSGKNKIAMDAQKKEYAKMYALIGSLTNVDKRTIETLKAGDLSLAESIGTLLFLA